MVMSGWLMSSRFALGLMPQPTSGRSLILDRGADRTTGWSSPDFNTMEYFVGGVAGRGIKLRVSISLWPSNYIYPMSGFTQMTPLLRWFKCDSSHLTPRIYSEVYVVFAHRRDKCITFNGKVA